MLEQMGKQAKDAAFILAQLTTAEKNRALSIIAEQLEQQTPLILAENAKDIELAKQNGLSDVLIAYCSRKNVCKALLMMYATLFLLQILWGKS